MATRWQVTEQAIDARRKAGTDAAFAAAMDRLWARLDLDPEDEGSPLIEAVNSKDRHLKRVLKALGGLSASGDESGGGAGRDVEPRISYETVEGPALPPPWLVWAVHLTHWPQDGVHTLVAMGVVNRSGKAWV